MHDEGCADRDGGAVSEGGADLQDSDVADEADNSAAAGDSVKANSQRRTQVRVAMTAKCCSAVARALAASVSSCKICNMEHTTESAMLVLTIEESCRCSALSGSPRVTAAAMKMASQGRVLPKVMMHLQLSARQATQSQTQTKMRCAYAAVYVKTGGGGVCYLCLIYVSDSSHQRAPCCDNNACTFTHGEALSSVTPCMVKTLPRHSAMRRALLQPSKAQPKAQRKRQPSLPQSSALLAARLLAKVPPSLP